MTTTLESTTTTRYGWVPFAALAAGAGWLLMSVLVFATEDDIDTPAVILYFAAFALSLAAAIGQGLRARRGRRALVAIGLSFAIVAWIMGVGDLLTPLFEQISKADYVADQGPLAVLGVVLVAWGALSRR